MSSRADSRGLLVGYWGNIGPISHYTVDGLASRGISINDDCRYPLQVTEDDLSVADLVIALKEAEHRPLLQQQFPRWADGIEYWHIDDLDCAGPEEALSALEEHLRRLVVRLEAERP